jgi:hypothetical protein
VLVAIISLGLAVAILIANIVTYGLKRRCTKHKTQIIKMDHGFVSHLYDQFSQLFFSFEISVEAVATFI